eukprot:s857_g19.t1
MAAMAAMALEEFCETNAVPCQEYRFRFFTFNLANSSSLRLEDIQGAGRELEESCLDPGQLHQYLQQLLPRYTLKTHSAVVEAGKMVNKVKGLLEDLAAKHSGDMQTHLAFHRSRFQEDSDGSFGLLTDLTLAGVRVPNPKKSFLGRSLCAPGGLRFCLMGAHFPISQLAAILDAEESAQKLGIQNWFRLGVVCRAPQPWVKAFWDAMVTCGDERFPERVIFLDVDGVLHAADAPMDSGEDTIAAVPKATLDLGPTPQEVRRQLATVKLSLSGATASDATLGDGCPVGALLCDVAQLRDVFQAAAACAVPLTRPKAVKDGLWNGQ